MPKQTLTDHALFIPQLQIFLGKLCSRAQREIVFFLIGQTNNILISYNETYYNPKRGEDIREVFQTLPNKGTTDPRVKFWLPK